MWNCVFRKHLNPWVQLTQNDNAPPSSALFSFISHSSKFADAFPYFGNSRIAKIITTTLSQDKRANRLRIAILECVSWMNNAIDCSNPFLSEEIEEKGTLSKCHWQHVSNEWHGHGFRPIYTWWFIESFISLNNTLDKINWKLDQMTTFLGDIESTKPQPKQQGLTLTMVNRGNISVWNCKCLTHTLIDLTMFSSHHASWEGIGNKICNSDAYILCISNIKKNQPSELTRELVECLQGTPHLAQLLFMVGKRFELFYVLKQILKCDTYSNPHHDEIPSPSTQF